MSDEQDGVMAKARNGVWTPWAQVLCVECEYTALKSSSRGDFYPRRLTIVSALDRTTEVACPDGDLRALCNKCRCACWTRADVALLQQVGYRSSDLDWEGPFGWALQQTGGMCSALVFSTEGRQIVVSAMDGAFYIGEYTHVDGEEDSWDQPLRTWASATFSENGVMKDASALGLLTEECARKAIDFIRHPAGATSA